MTYTFTISHPLNLLVIFVIIILTPIVSVQCYNNTLLIVLCMTIIFINKLQYITQT